MGLASQSSRTERVASTQKGRGGITFILVSAAAVAAVGGAIWLMRGGGEALGPRSANASEASPSMPASVADQPGQQDGELDGSGPTSRRDALEVHPSPVNEAESATSRGPADELPATDSTTGAGSTVDDTAPADADSQDGAPTTDEPAKQDEPSAEKPAEKPAERLTPPYFGNGFNGAIDPLPQQSTASSPAVAKLQEGLGLAASEPVKARLLLSQALLGGTLDEAQSRQAADALSHLSAQLFLTPVYNANDPICTQYTIQPNDSLEKIVRKNKLGCDWRLVARLNNIKNPRAIQVGKRLKLPNGPFSAVVSKRDYRLYLCVGSGDERVVVASLAVGLGEANGTPSGAFKVRSNSKLINPEWIHPVTGQRFEADDPANPIGEYWLGLEGIESSNSALLGYGIHGTIDPDSIGHDRSLGCVRLLADDVALVWEALAEGSEVVIWSASKQ
ncbi:MAG: L,D-transpeptidase family protein [Phycisphaerales bacterium]